MKIKYVPIHRRFVRGLYSAVRFILRSNPKQIGFVSSPDLSDSCFALFERVLHSTESQKFRLVWLVDKPVAAKLSLERQFLKEEIGNVLVVKRRSLRGLLAFLRCRYVFLSHGTFWFVRSGDHQTIVELWHGMPIKAIGAFDGKSPGEVPFMHYSVATSGFFADIVAKSFYIPRDRVLVTGLPRNQLLFQAEERYVDIKRRRSKLVVWLPTYRSSYLGEIRVDSAGFDPDPLSSENLAMLDAMLDGSDTVLRPSFTPWMSRIRWNGRATETFTYIQIRSSERRVLTSTNCWLVPMLW